MEACESEKTAQYLWTIANRLSTTCPAASRIYMSNLKRNLDDEPKLLKKEIKPHLYCKYCGSLWAPRNHKIRIQPPPSPNSHIKKLLKCEKEQPWRLNNRHKKKLKKFRESTSKIIYSCSVCKKKTAFPGIKKYRKETCIPLKTSTPKVKSKKGDLNAGLFIKTPVENDSHKKLTLDAKEKEHLSSDEQSTVELQKSNLKNTSKLSHSFTPILVKQNVTPSQKSSSKKRKKGLLEQILNQEQEAKKQKKNLSSFLISL